ncbi:MAG: glucose-1-phosphate adenylyltransferase [Pseudomonadota bacterium]
MEMNKVCAVILGGGQGTRLRPLTRDRAKPAVALAGKYRLIDVPLSNCIHSGIKKMFVVTQFSSVSLHRHIMQTYAFDHFSDGFIDILAAAQTNQRSNWYQGTADAVRGTLPHIHYFKSNATLILSGDHLYRMDYRRLLQFHDESNADITLAACPVNRTAASQMGLLRATDKGRVHDFVEKPKDDAVIAACKAPVDLCRAAGHATHEDLFLASMGIYVFRPQVLTELLSSSNQIDFGREVIPSALGRFNVNAYLFAGYWRDIGSIRDFFDANISLAQPEAPFSLYQPGWPFFTHARSLAPCRVVGSTIVDSLLAEGSDIHGAEIADSVIGVRSVIRPGSHLREVVMLGADFYEGDQLAEDIVVAHDDMVPLGIGPDCRLERVILDKNVHLGDGVVIRRQPDGANVDGDLFCVRDGITVIPGNTVIPAGTVI